MIEKHPHHRGPSLNSYLAGFILSVLLTISAFAVAHLHISSDHQRIPHDLMVFAVVALALIQLCVQAVFFLHLSRKEDARHNLISFIFTVFVVIFIGIGTLWIMDNLNRNMTSQQIDSYMHKEN